MGLRRQKLLQSTFSREIGEYNPALIAFKLLSDDEQRPTEHLPATNIIRPGTLLVEQGKHLVGVQLIHEGLVELAHVDYGGREVVIGLRSQGWYAGGISVILKTPSVYSVRTKSSCRTTQLTATEFLLKLIQNPILMRNFTCNLCEEINSHARLNWIAPNEAERSRTRLVSAAPAPSITPDHLSKLIHKIYFRELRAARAAQGNYRPEWVPATCCDAVGQEALKRAEMVSVAYCNGSQSGEARVSDKGPRSMDETFTKEKAIAWYWEFAQKAPEEMRGNLKYHIEACRQMYALGHEPALARLSELANIDVARTKGHRRGQDAAARLLKRLPSIKVNKTKEVNSGYANGTGREADHRPGDCVCPSPNGGNGS
jgi:CRP-like cAMP-binding protein